MFDLCLDLVFYCMLFTFNPLYSSLNIFPAVIIESAVHVCAVVGFFLA